MNFFSFAFTVSAICVASGLRCWECHNAHSNEECLRIGRVKECRELDAICEDVVRHDQNGNGYLIEKRCKQTHACDNNVDQNIRPAYPIQCNPKSPTSTCRCCCNRDLCNENLLACWRQLPQYESPLQVEERKCDERPPVPEHGNMQCQGNLEPGTLCEFKCHDGYFRHGERRTRCKDDLSWDNPPPECRPLICPPARVAPGNGTMTCTDGINHRSRCNYECNEDFALIGPSYTECIDIDLGNGRGIWSSYMPYCKALVCPHQGPVINGRMSCTDDFKLGSQCTFHCRRDYQLYPASASSANVCTREGIWSSPVPCCSIRCPPNVVMDFIVVLDSSSSVGAENWERMKNFVRSFLDDFTVRNDAAHYAIIRYNRVVDTDTQILLNDYPNNIRDLLRAFDRIPYDGSGTFTGNALNYTADVLLRDGNRPQARDIVLLITDGASQDEVEGPAKRVRDTGALLYVLPVLPPRGRLDLDEIEVIAGPGNQGNIIRAALEGGFEALNEDFAREMSELLCPEPCATNPFD